MASLVGAIAALAIIVSVFGFFVLSFIGSSSAASSSARLVLERADVRRAVAVELVNILDESDNNFARIILGVAHDRIVDVVEESLNDKELRSVASEAVASAYEVYVNDAPSALIDIQPFADSAFAAIRSINPLFLEIFQPQIEPLKISRDEQDPNLGAMIAKVRVATWAFLFGGLVLLAISWSISVAGKWIRLRRLGIRFLAWGIALTVLANIAPNMIFGEDHTRPLLEALALFAANRLQTWSIILAAIGLVVATLGVLMSQDKS